MSKVTDQEALEALKATKLKGVNVATEFVKTTVVYPVQIYYKKDVPTTEIRTFVRAGEYCSPSQAARAAELEKEYPELNKDYRKALKDKKLPVTAKESPLRAVPLSR